MVLAVVIGLVVFYLGKNWLFAEKVDADSLEVTSEFRGLGSPKMSRVA